MMRYFENYCTECDWNASTEEYESHTAIGKEAIDHHVDSGHSIDARSLTHPDSVELVSTP